MDGQGQRDVVGDFVGGVYSHGPDPNEQAINEALGESRSVVPTVAVRECNDAPSDSVRPRHCTEKEIDRHWERVDARRRRQTGEGRDDKVETREKWDEYRARDEEADQRRRRRQAGRDREEEAGRPGWSYSETHDHWHYGEGSPLYDNK